jgi:hypothetical protein
MLRMSGKAMRIFDSRFAIADCARFSQVSDSIGIRNSAIGILVPCLLRNELFIVCGGEKRIKFSRIFQCQLEHP